MGVALSLQYSAVLRTWKFEKSEPSLQISVRAVLQLNYNVVLCIELEKVVPILSYSFWLFFFF